MDEPLASCRPMSKTVLVLISIFRSLSLFFFLLLFRAAPTVHGGSQAGGPIEAVATAYTTATAMQDPSHICDLHCNSWQCWILKPLSKARDQTCILMDPSRVP